MKLGQTGNSYDCGVCERDPTFKELWGCEDETAERPFSIGKRDGGTEEIRRCPVALLSGTGVESYFTAHYRLKTYNLPPEAGGDRDQPRKLMAAIDFIENEITKHQEQEANKRGG